MILEIIENAPMVIIPTYLCYLILRMIFKFGITPEKEHIVSLLKFMFCLVITMTIIISTLIVIIYQIFQVALIWQEYELSHQIEPWIKSVSYASIEFIWSLIAAVLSWQIFKNVYYKQIISGEGTVKQRISTHLKKFKTKRVKE